MKKLTMVAVAAAIALPVGGAAFAQGKPSHPESSGKGTINISCYRGALKTVAWDRPNAVFIEDLLSYGYTWKQAHTIGERVCRDEYGVGNGEHKIATLKRLMVEHPVGSDF
ncbi:hypothetical protein CLV78_102600 [Aliiruegeria haliotis]|uniref:HdeA/HdeB family protein n=1 Tax=Aliiruegeria haliotis TaxID=1280846 RepID=A0A2T0RW73_9RHOB|nr:hypothetical protein [Aliiruegeria haliotis]PRY25421.1 hypothetical protein CLV78_102600 [Aliiruegeria haliotis]